MPQRAKGAIDPATGLRIRDLREKRGMTQAQLAGDDFTKGFISLIEHGHTRISLRAAEIFASRLAVPVTTLFSAAAFGDTGELLPLDGIADLADRLARLSGRAHDARVQLELKHLAGEARRLASRRVVSAAAVQQRVKRSMHHLEELAHALEGAAK